MACTLQKENMEEWEFDFVVIGSGPAGQKGAIQAAKLGKKVAIIEKDTVPGGACLNSGTIPSKSLREAIIDLSRFNERSFYGKFAETKVTINDLNYRLNTVLEGEREILARQFKKNKIKYLTGRACFENPHCLSVISEEFLINHPIKASKILISTGSIPRNPLNVPFDNEIILDSNRLLQMAKVPKTMVVLGGGIVGTEYGSFFAALGTEVTILDKRDRLLPLLDKEIGCHLQVGLREIGLKFAPRKIPKMIYRENNKGIVLCEDGTIFEGEVVLYALGREANVSDLAIENAGLSLNKDGYLDVNENFQTKVQSIYAAGDVIGYPALASTSMEQGRLAARHAFGARTHPFPTFFPLGIYTIPEISCCGKNEEELIKEEIPFEVGRAYYYEIARSHIAGASQFGLFKLLFHKETLEILGAHIVGRSATELIHIGQVAMTFRAKIDYFVDQVFNYPTFAEGYRIAALNGLNKLKTNT